MENGTRCTRPSGIGVGRKTHLYADYIWRLEDRKYIETHGRSGLKMICGWHTVVLQQSAQWAHGLEYMYSANKQV